MAFTITVGTSVVSTALVLLAASVSMQPTRPWQSEFNVDKATLSPSGRNRFFVLEPGQQSVFGNGDEQLTITVLRATERVDGVVTAVVEERETKNGQLVEVSRNFFAIARDSSVYYFGEDVDMYAKGKVTSHEGSWRAGVSGAKFGLMMPGRPVVGARYQQEVAPKVAMDRAEVVSVTESVKVPAGSYTLCIRVEETTPLEPGVKEYKRYCPGVGLVEDSDLTLQRVGVDPRQTGRP